MPLGNGPAGFKVCDGSGGKVRHSRRLTHPPLFAFAVENSLPFFPEPSSAFPHRRPFKPALDKASGLHWTCQHFSAGRRPAQPGASEENVDKFSTTARIRKVFSR